MCTLGTHTVSFAANDKRDAEVRRRFENLDVGDLRFNPLHARGTAEEEARKENKPGTYRQSFRPFMWVWASDEERSSGASAYQYRTNRSRGIRLLRHGPSQASS